MSNDNIQSAARVAAKAAVVAMYDSLFPDADESIPMSVTDRAMFLTAMSIMAAHVLENLGIPVDVFSTAVKMSCDDEAITTGVPDVTH